MAAVFIFIVIVGFLNSSHLITVSTLPPSYSANSKGEPRAKRRALEARRSPAKRLRQTVTRTRTVANDQDSSRMEDGDDDGDDDESDAHQVTPSKSDTPEAERVRPSSSTTHQDKTTVFETAEEGFSTPPNHTYHSKEASQADSAKTGIGQQARRTLYLQEEADKPIEQETDEESDPEAILTSCGSPADASALLPPLTQDPTHMDCDDDKEEEEQDEGSEDEHGDASEDGQGQQVDNVSIFKPFEETAVATSAFLNANRPLADKLDHCIKVLHPSYEAKFVALSSSSEDGTFQKQLEEVEKFTKGLINSQGASGRKEEAPVLYVCGAAGVGKTSGIKWCCTELKRLYGETFTYFTTNAAMWSADSTDSLVQSFANAMGRASARARNGGADIDSLSAVEQWLRTAKTESTTILLVIDEVDFAVSNQNGPSAQNGLERTLATLLQWAKNPSLPFGIIGLSNSVGNRPANRLHDLGMVSDVFFPAGYYLVDVLDVEFVRARNLPFRSHFDLPFVLLFRCYCLR